MADATGDSSGGGPGRDADKEERDRHWRELLERRRERDKRLEEMEARGDVPTVSGVAPDAADKKERLGILERMRDESRVAANPVAEKEEEKARQRARATARAQKFAALFALVAVVAVAAWVVLSGSGRYEVTAHFENASQLVKGNEVLVGGTPVGSVDKIELGDNGEALVTFTVDDDYAPLARGTIATIRSPSLSAIAGRQIELAVPPSGEGVEEIPSGGELSQSETVSAVDLDEIFNTLNDKTVADLKKVIKGFADSTEGVGQQANRGFVYLNPFLSTSRRLFGELTLDERTLEQLIVDGSQLSGAVAAKRDDVVQLVSNLNQATGAIANQRTALTQALSELPDFMRNFDTTAVNLRATLDDLDPLVDASKPVAIKLRPFFAQLRSASHNLVPTLTDLDQVIETPGPDNDLVDLTRLQNPLTKIAIGPVNRHGKKRQGAFPESVQSLDGSLKQLAFFRAYTPELVGWFNDFGPSSGIVEANGGLSRIGVTFNTFALSLNGLPDITGIPQTPQAQIAGMSTGNLERCPGSNERPAPDGSNPFTDNGTLDCDPSQIPPGN